MRIKLAAAQRKRRARAFTPSRLNGAGEWRLEARVLARPAIFRSPFVGLPNGGVAVLALPEAPGAAVPLPARQTDSEATATYVQTITTTPPFPPGSASETGTVTSTITDGPDTGPPAPVGVFGVSINDVHSGFTTISGFGAFLPVRVATVATGGRAYVLADDNQGPANFPNGTMIPATVTSTWHYTLFPGNGNFAFPPIAGAAGSNITAGLAGAVTVPPGAPNLLSTTVAVAPGSVLVSSTITATDVRVVITTPVMIPHVVPVFPLPPNPMAGTPFPVAFATAFETFNDTTTNAVPSMTYHYDFTIS
ncbi:MAG: hypothetical protein P4L84_19425 [Isosphaeraceae bacterium]|nr:hypothetical protein [Isosphaeraceae bacterium]